MTVPAITSGALPGRALDRGEKLPELFAQKFRRIGDAHPASLAQAVFEPGLAHLGHSHQIHVDATGAVAVSVAIAADRPARDDAAQPCFFVSLADRRVARLLTRVDRSLRHDPSLASRCGDQSDLDALLPNPVRNHRCLSVGHHSSSLIRGASPLGLPNTLPPSREALRRDLAGALA